MLKNIPAIISPDLMYAMMCMGHGDELVLVDMDFPAYTYGKKIIRADGISISELLKAILPFFPLDTFVENPVMIMAPVEENREPPTWGEFKKIISKYYKDFNDFKYIERFDFYERSKNSFAVVVTGEPDGNIILKKGVVTI